MQLIALLVVVLQSAPADSLQIRFVGNAGFELSDGATTLLVDLPYESGAFDLMTYDPTELDPVGHVISVITHRHADHFDPGLFAPHPWGIIGPGEVTAAFDDARVLEGRIVIAGEFRVQRFATSHSDVEHYSYLIEWRGQRLYFVGDTEDPSHVLSTEDLDILFVTPWLSCRIEASGRSVDVQRTILHHQFPDGRLDVCGNAERVASGEQFAIPPR